MSEAKAKLLNSRVQNKHDIEANWNRADNFRPLKGEIIIYDPDEDHRVSRIKIGDGEHFVKQLDFADAELWEAFDEKADIEHGTHVSFSTASPTMDGTAFAGIATTVARSDHKHPSDSTKVSYEDLAAHTNSTLHITAAERTAWNDTKTQIANVSTTYETKLDASTKLADAKRYADTKFSALYTKADIDEAIAAIEAKVDEKLDASAIDSLISVGISDPSAAITSQFYFKYTTD